MDSYSNNRDWDGLYNAGKQAGKLLAEIDFKQEESLKAIERLIERLEANVAIAKVETATKLSEVIGLMYDALSVNYAKVLLSKEARAARIKAAEYYMVPLESATEDKAAELSFRMGKVYAKLSTEAVNGEDLTQYQRTAIELLEQAGKLYYKLAVVLLKGQRRAEGIVYLENSAEAYLESAYLNKSAGNDERSAYNYLEAAKIDFALNRLDIAGELLQEAVSIAEIYAVEGIDYYHAQDFKTAGLKQRQAAKIYEKIAEVTKSKEEEKKFNALAARNYGLSAVNFNHAGLFAEAMVSVKEEIRLNEETKNYLELVNATVFAAQVSQAGKDYISAAEYNVKAADINEILGREEEA
jgi:tetratricopeptide (TPR) repeat protein